MGYKNVEQVMEYIKDLLSLSDAFEYYGIELIPSGTGRYKCLSPFKEEKTPSCFIDDSKCKYYDFSTEEKGDLFDFIGYKESTDLIETFDIIEQKLSIDLSQFKEEMTVEELVQQRLYQQTRTVVEQQHENLPQKVIDYLHGRGITDDAIEEYKLGYVGFDGIPECENHEYLQLDSRMAFRDAILLPVTDTHGNYIYFQTRPFTPMGGKYVLPKESHPLMTYPRIFGFPQAKKLMRSTGKPLVIVEGVFDVIALWQIGIPSICAFGTHLDDTFWNFLDEFKIKKVVLCFDGDDTGIKKSIKAGESLINLETRPKTIMRIADAPNDGLDPNDRINQMGCDSMESIINNAKICEEFIINKRYNGCTDDTAKADFIDSVIPIMSKCKDKVVFRVCNEVVARLTGFDPSQTEDIFLSSREENEPLTSIESEEVILGKALRDWQFAQDFINEFEVDDWTLIRHKQLFKLFKNAEFVDADSILISAQNYGYDNITDEYIEYLKKRTGKTGFAMLDFKDKIMRRKAIKSCTNLIDQLHDLETDSSIEIDKGTNEIYSSVHSGTMEHIGESKDVVDSFMRTLHERMTSKTALVGYSFGNSFSQLDAHTLGLAPSELCMVSATSSEGKSMLCCNWIVEWAVNQNVPVLLFSLEMSQEENMMRMVSIISGVSASKIMVGNLSDEEYEKVREASILLRNAPLEIATTGHNLSEMLSIAKRYVSIGKAKIIVVDYVQLATTDTGRRSDTRTIELGKISKGLRQFALENNIPIVMVSQLGKQAKGKETQEMEDVYGAYELSQDSSLAIAIRTKSEVEIQTHGLQNGNKVLTIMKNRRGAKDVLINAYHEAENFRVSEC